MRIPSGRTKIIKITFRSAKDFRDRIAALWQDQKDDEHYEFEFLNKEGEEEYERLMDCFSKPISLEEAEARALSRGQRCYSHVTVPDFGCDHIPDVKKKV